MSHMASGVLGTVAAALALGAVHLEVAAGNDLLGPGLRGDASISAATINRAAKGDRESADQAGDSVTISYNVPGVKDSSVVMRVPAGTSAQAKRLLPSINKGSAAWQTVACEAPVSMLTAVAKQLQPGRCVT